tara:strand:- start:49 stop:414 length:366 start_codon:yes stop_codon:yes gene_type:complete
MITVFYDGKCNLCSKEINYYKLIADDNLFKWLDIANNPKYLSLIGISEQDALLYLHATDENNNLFIGVDAFLLIWKNIKYWRILYFFLSQPIIKQFSNFIYKKFANYRFSKLSHCQLSKKI